MSFARTIRLICALLLLVLSFVFNTTPAQAVNWATCANGVGTVNIVLSAPVCSYTPPTATQNVNVHFDVTNLCNVSLSRCEQGGTCTSIWTRKQSTDCRSWAAGCGSLGNSTPNGSWSGDYLDKYDFCPVKQIYYQMHGSCFGQGFCGATGADFSSQAATTAYCGANPANNSACPVTQTTTTASPIPSPSITTVGTSSTASPKPSPSPAKSPSPTPHASTSASVHASPSPSVYHTTSTLASPANTTQITPSVAAGAPAQQSTSTASTVYGPPQVLAPVNGEIISGIKKVYVSAREESTIDLVLQVNQDNIGTLYLGRITIDKGQSVGYFSWDTKNTPNGEYQFYAMVNRAGDSQLITDSVKLKVDNSLQTVEQTIISSNQVSSSGKKAVPVSELPKNSTASAIINNLPRNLSDKELNALVTTETTKDIVFPSQFNPGKTTENKKITINKVENIKVDSKKIALNFHGVANPNQIIYLMIYSNPIVVSVKADDNGLWTYNLEKPLNGGDHVAYVVVPTKEGNVRSAVARFAISEVFAASSNNESLLLTSGDEEPLTKFIWATVIVISIGIGLLGLVFWYKNRFPKPLEQPQQ